MRLEMLVVGSTFLHEIAVLHWRGWCYVASRFSDMWLPLLTPSRPDNETAGNEQDWAKRNETAGEPAFCLVRAGFRIPLAPLI